MSSNGGILEKVSFSFISESMGLIVDGQIMPKWSNKIRGLHDTLLQMCPHDHVLFQMKSVLAVLLLGASLTLGDSGPSQEGYGGGGGGQQFYTPQVKYAGPIVYSGEKPPIIHFPPPPEVCLLNHIHFAIQYNRTIFSHRIPMEGMEEAEVISHPPQSNMFHCLIMNFLF